MTLGSAVLLARKMLGFVVSSEVCLQRLHEAAEMQLQGLHLPTDDVAGSRETTQQRLPANKVSQCCTLCNLRNKK